MKGFLSLIGILMLLAYGGQGNARQGGGWVNLFNGKNLDGWRILGGEAAYEVVDGTIVGTSGAGANTFLATNDLFSDFILEFEAKIDDQLNSGVQFRSNSKADYMNGRVHGYQLELDTSDRRWTGGIYDEARRGWLYPLTRNEKATTAYRANTWNKFRVEAIGSTIRTWVNGIPVANLADNMTAKGFIALQVHSVYEDSLLGKQVSWRNIRIKTEGLVNERLEVDAAEDIEQFNYIANTLTDAETGAGWKLLWDGKTTNGWRSARAGNFPAEGWEIKDSILSVLASGGGESTNGGDIITEQEYSNFELQLDFRITEGANSGIKYFVDTDLLKGEGSAIGLEYQILDDDRHPDATQGMAGNRTVASLYDLIPATNLSELSREQKRVNPPGSWNRARIVVRGNHIQHWLNNVKVVDYDRGVEMFSALVAHSKYAVWENFGRWEKGPILLQDHGDLVSFHSIKIREVAPEEMKNDDTPRFY